MEARFARIDLNRSQLNLGVRRPRRLPCNSYSCCSSSLCVHTRPGAITIGEPGRYRYLPEDGMASLLSWIWSPLAGMLTVICLVVSWGALISVLFAIIGVTRRRCGWKVIPIYVAVCIIGSLGFQAVFWISDRIARGDTFSTVLFWGAVFLAGFGALGQGFSLLRETWSTTNGSPRAAA